MALERHSEIGFDAPLLSKSFEGDIIDLLTGTTKTNLDTTGKGELFAVHPEIPIYLVQETLWKPKRRLVETLGSVSFGTKTYSIIHIKDLEEEESKDTVAQAMFTTQRSTRSLVTETHDAAMGLI